MFTNFYALVTTLTYYWKYVFDRYYVVLKNKETILPKEFQTSFLHTLPA